MKARLVVSFSALALMLVPALSRAKPALHPRVTPKVGSRASSFVVRFKLPKPTGSHGGIIRSYRLAVKTAQPAGGCVHRIDRTVPGGGAGARVRVKLDPAHSGKRWCIGDYRGEIDELDSAACPKGKVCPAFVSLRRVGKFALHVHASGDTSPPGFAGLRSAMTCIPGPVRLGGTAMFNLSWNAATDDITPSSQIVYDVYYSKTRGGETFSHPTWTTAPGATSFRTGAVSSDKAAYFVVRARDAAGNEDGNKVERAGANLCV